MPSLSDLRRQLDRLQVADPRESTFTQTLTSEPGASPGASLKPLKPLKSIASHSEERSNKSQSTSTRSAASSSTITTDASERTAHPKEKQYNFTYASIEESAVLSAAYRAVNKECKKTVDGVRYGVCRVLVGKNATSSSSRATSAVEGVSGAQDIVNAHGEPTQSTSRTTRVEADPPTIAPILLLTARRITSLLLLSPHLFFLAPCDTRGGWNGVILLGSDVGSVERAWEGLRARFGRRLKTEARAPGGSGDKGRVWTGWIDALDGSGMEDEEAIWGILARATVSTSLKEGGEEGKPARPSSPPGSRGIQEMVKRARRKFVGLSPKEAWEELQQPLTATALAGLDAGIRDARASVQLGSTTTMTKARYLIDIRPSEEHLSKGRIPNAYPIELTKLEISLDPRLELSEGRTSLAVDYDVRYILLSEDGRASSLAAVRLMELGLWNVSDVVGGFAAWRADGLPFYN